MKRLSPALLVLLLIFGLVACTTPNRQTQVTQGDQKSYIFFSGNAANATAYIDGKGVVITEEMVSGSTSGIQDNYQLKPGAQGRNLIQVAPGKHEVKVIKENQILAHRIILVGEGVAFEVAVP